jgi:hypothetical protein
MANKNFANLIMKSIVSILMLAVTMIACTTSANNDAAVLRAQQNTIDSLNAVQAATAENQRIIDSMQQISVNQEIIRSNQDATSSSTATTTTTETVKKKGMSATATGAIIGAGAGAITGAIISKKKGEGVIVGGVIGAAAGAGTGAIIDANKKKKANQ